MRRAEVWIFIRDEGDGKLVEIGRFGKWLECDLEMFSTLDYAKDEKNRVKNGWFKENVKK